MPHRHQFKVGLGGRFAEVGGEGGHHLLLVLAEQAAEAVELVVAPGAGPGVAAAHRGPHGADRHRQLRARGAGAVGPGDPGADIDGRGGAGGGAGAHGWDESGYHAGRPQALLRLGATGKPPWPSVVVAGAQRGGPSAG